MPSKMYEKQTPHESSVHFALLQRFPSSHVTESVRLEAFRELFVSSHHLRLSS